MNTILTKFKIKPPHRLLCLHAPADFEAKMAADTPGCTFSSDASQPFDSVHWFVKTKTEVEADLAGVLALLRPGLPVWAYYPKGSSGIQTDLTRDKGWDALLQNQDIRWLTQVSFDDRWTAFCFRLQTEKERTEAGQPKAIREIFQYADSATKTIRLPEDMQAILEKHPVERALFEALSFSHRREYVEWVITAKQEKTRQTRLEGAIERLRQGLKNPAGR